MKRFILALIVDVGLLPTLALANIQLTPSQYTNIGLTKPFDTLGRDRKPDSAHVFVDTAAGTTPIYSARSTSWPFTAIGIDSTVLYGDTSYALVALISTLNNGTVKRTITVHVKLWCTGNKDPKETFSIIDVISHPVDSMPWWGSFLGTRQFAKDSCVSSDSLLDFAAKRFLDSLSIRDSAGVLYRDSSFSNGLYAWIKSHGGTLTNAQIAVVADSIWQRKIHNKTTNDSSAQYYLRSGFQTLSATAQAALVTAIFANKLIGSYATYDSSFGYLARVSLDTANQPSTADIAQTLLFTDTAGYDSAGTIGEAILAGCVGGSLDVAALSNWADTAGILKANMGTTQVVFGGLHIEGTATDTFPGALSVRYNPTNTPNKPSVYLRGGAGGLSGHGILSQGGASGGSGMYVAAPVSDAFTITGLTGTINSGLAIYSGSGEAASEGEGAVKIIGSGNYKAAIWVLSNNYNGIDVQSYGVGPVQNDAVTLFSLSGDGMIIDGGGYIGRDLVIGDGTGYISGNLAKVDTLTNYARISLLDEDGNRRAVMPGSGWTAQDYIDYGGSGTSAWTTAQVDSLMGLLRAAGFTGNITVHGTLKVSRILDSGANSTGGSFKIFNSSGAGLIADGNTATNDIVGYLSTVSPMSVYGVPNVNVYSIDTSIETAQNMRLIFDGSNATLGTMSLSQLYIRQSGLNVSAIDIASALGSGITVNGLYYGATFVGQTHAGLAATTLSPGSEPSFLIGTTGIGAQPYWVDTLKNSAGGATAGEILVLAQDHPEYFYGPTANGSGAYTITITVQDSSATPDSTLEGIKVTVCNAGGTSVAFPVSNGAGVAVCYLDGGTYTLKSYNVGYSFDSAVIVVSGNDGVTFKGRSSLRTNKAYVWGYLKNIDGTPVQLGSLYMTMPENAKNSCDSSIIIQRTVSCRTDATGYFVFPNPVTWSSCFNNTAYDLQIVVPGAIQTRKLKITVPDATTYQVVL